MAAANETLVQQYFQDILGRGNPAAAAELLSPDVTLQGLQIIEGIDDFMQYVLGLHTAFPDLAFIVEDEVNDGTKAAGRFTMRGRHRGEFLGIPATNNRVEIRGVDLFHIRAGRITEIWDSIDTLAFMQQLGAIPSQENHKTFNRGSH